MDILNALAIQDVIVSRALEATHGGTDEYLIWAKILPLKVGSATLICDVVDILK